MRRRTVRLSLCATVLALLGGLVSACVRVEHGAMAGQPTFPSVAARPTSVDPATSRAHGVGSAAGLDPDLQRAPVAVIDGRAMFDLGDGVRIYAFWSPGVHDQPWSVLVHGGSWRWGDAADAAYVDWAAHEKSRGWAAFSIDYRLVPSVTWPAPEDDVQRAVTWIRAHADYFGLARADGFLVGHSAGGQLGSIAALQLGGFAGVVSAAGATDPYLLYRNRHNPTLAHAAGLLIHDRVRSRQAWAEVDASSYLGRHVMPFLVIQSVADPEVPFAVGRRFATNLRAHHYPTTFHPVAGDSHGLWSVPDTAAIDRWMDDVLVRRSLGPSLP